MAHKKLKTGENGAVRISFSVFNSKKDVYELCDKIKSITK
jgi:selenocysteine lyase/cysteine desulfurase